MACVEWVEKRREECAQSEDRGYLSTIAAGLGIVIGAAIVGKFASLAYANFRLKLLIRQFRCGLKQSSW